MSTATGVRGHVARGNDEQFLDLICSDDQFVQAEFDAIIAAEWPDPPRPNHAAVPTRASVAAPPRPPRHPGLGERPRQPYLRARQTQPRTQERR